MANRSQAPGDATVLKRFFRDNFVIFRRRSKRIAFLESVKKRIFLCVNSRWIENFQFSSRSRDHFSAPFRGLYLLNSLSQTLQTSKRHTFRVSAFHRYRYHWFGVKLFPVGCAHDSKRVPYKGEKCCFGSGSAHATKFRNFSR